jgi:hypothetical protein
MKKKVTEEGKEYLKKYFDLPVLFVMGRGNKFCGTNIVR